MSLLLWSVHSVGVLLNNHDMRLAIASRTPLPSLDPDRDQGLLALLLEHSSASVIPIHKSTCVICISRTYSLAVLFIRLFAVLMQKYSSSHKETWLPVPPAGRNPREMVSPPYNSFKT